jgi:hypothetical protein
MRLNIFFALLAMFFGLFITVPSVQPFWDDFNAVQRDCVYTKPANRTEKQRKQCESSGRPYYGLIIPGII